MNYEASEHADGDPGPSAFRIAEEKPNQGESSISSPGQSLPEASRAESEWHRTLLDSTPCQVIPDQPMYITERHVSACQDHSVVRQRAAVLFGHVAKPLRKPTANLITNSGTRMLPQLFGTLTANSQFVCPTPASSEYTRRDPLRCDCTIQRRPLTGGVCIGQRNDPAVLREPANLKCAQWLEDNCARCPTGAVRADDARSGILSSAGSRCATHEAIVDRTCSVSSAARKRKIFGRIFGRYAQWIALTEIETTTRVRTTLAILRQVLQA